MTSRRNILFVHQNFPGQFPHIADALVARGDKVVALAGRTARQRPGVELHRWSNSRSTTPGIFEAAIRAEADLVRAQAAALTAVRLRESGFQPDLIIGHPGWGETLHLREVFPRARLILLGEYYLQTVGGDTGFDPEFESGALPDRMLVNAKRATGALAFSLADRIVCPTPFQASTFPEVFHSRINVLHEGLDFQRARHRPGAGLELESGRVLDRETPVITYVSRRLERIRGFHIFMRALPEVLAACPTAEAVILGSDTDAGYTARLPEGQTWKSKMLAEVGHRLDSPRVHFLGQVPHERMVDAMSISSAHVYYTYPFVLSWSLIEAMGCECLIVGSDTAPVRDAVTDGETGILNDFFDVAALSRTLIQALQEPERFSHMRPQARRAVLERFDRRTVGLPGWLQLIDTV